MTADISDSSDQPTLSVITVVFNGMAAIERTINSVLSQDHPQLEYIIVDGGSTDGTLDVIWQYEDRLDRFVSEPDEGIYDAMNKGIGLASGEFILFMNCGDEFASSDALSSAMSNARPGDDQIMFGRWLRQSGDTLTLCHPKLNKGLFHHQAVIYSRSIHAWHGGYVSVKGLTTADYLFFATLFDSPAVTCRVIKTELAIIDINGVSAGLQTYSQKSAIDYICGRVTKTQLLLVLIAHPIYHRIKSLLGLRR